jgi:outer membrane receptor protein involved in Fe transport
MRGLISQDKQSNSAFFPMNTYSNKINAVSHGVEYQINWRPTEETRVQFNNARTYTKSQEQPDLDTAVPHSIYSLALFQKLPANWDVSLMYSFVGAMSWRGAATTPDFAVLNARVARAFRIGKTRAELALTSQSIHGDQIQFISSTPDHPIVPLVPRRTFLSLRLEY